jgi:rubrerythrin
MRRTSAKKNTRNQENKRIRARPKHQARHKPRAHRPAAVERPILSLVPTIRNKASEIAAELGSGIMRTFESLTESVSRDSLLEFLSEFLAVEQGGMELYIGARDHATHEENREMYKMYLEQTRKHAELLTGAIRKLGGDPKYVSPCARIQQHRAKAMMGLQVPDNLREIVDAENLLLAETKDHADWEFLDSISYKLDDEFSREVIQEIVSQVEDQEDEHLKFAGKAVERLAHEMAVKDFKRTKAVTVKKAA